MGANKNKLFNSYTTGTKIILAHNVEFKIIQVHISYGKRRIYSIHKHVPIHMILDLSRYTNITLRKAIILIKEDINNQKKKLLALLEKT